MDRFATIVHKYYKPLHMIELSGVLVNSPATMTKVKGMLDLC